MSSIQWAELLTSMNVGDGVPCTVRHVLGDGEEVRGEPPSTGNGADHVRDEYNGRLRERADEIAELRSKLTGILRGKVSAKVAEEADNVLANAEQDIRTNTPWFVRRFREETDRVATAVKAEVDAFLTHAAVTLGVKAIRDGGLSGLLEARKGEEDE